MFQIYQTRLDFKISFWSAQNDLDIKLYDRLFAAFCEKSERIFIKLIFFWTEAEQASFIQHVSGNVRSAYNLLIINLADLKLSRDYYIISVDLYKCSSFKIFCDKV